MAELPGTLPTTLLALFGTMDTESRFYDLGRRVTPILTRDFDRFENAVAPYPYPQQRHAWLGVLFWPTSVEPVAPGAAHAAGLDPNIWFLKLPLDEQGKLVLASRDYLLRRVYDDFARRWHEKRGPLVEGTTTSTAETETRSLMDDNPFVFRPAEEKLAVFRAKTTLALGLAPSDFFPRARSYFRGEQALGNWADVGFQGVAEFAVRIGIDNNAEALAAVLPDLPAEPFIALCSCLESEAIGAKLSEVIAERAYRIVESERSGAGASQCGVASGKAAAAAKRNGLESVVTGASTDVGDVGNVGEIAGVVRGLAQSDSAKVRESLVSTILDSSWASDIEVLAAIAGRAWETLEAPEISTRFFECLAGTDAGQPGFDAVALDLLFMPGMRRGVLETLRGSGRSALLAERIGAFFASAYQTPRPAQS